MTLIEKIKELGPELKNMTIKEVSEKLNCDNSHVGKTVKKLGLKCKKADKSKYGFMVKAGHRYSRIKKLVELGYTNQEICLLTDEKQTNLIKYKHKVGIPCNQYRKVELTNIQKQVIIGSSLGDAYIEPSDSNKTAAIVFKHSLKQKDFLEFKKNCLTTLIYPSKQCMVMKTKILKKRKSILDGREIESEAIETRTMHHPCLTYYRDIFYPNGVKIVPKEILDEIDAMGIAVWFMDDGIKYHGYSFKICTHSFSKENVNLLVDMFKKRFNINSHCYTDSGNYNILVIDASSIHDFRRLIEPYIIPSMAYKLYENKMLE
jgi:hypothetical protein